MNNLNAQAEMKIFRHSPVVHVICAAFPNLDGLVFLSPVEGYFFGRLCVEESRIKSSEFLTVPSA